MPGTFCVPFSVIILFLFFNSFYNFVTLPTVGFFFHFHPRIFSSMVNHEHLPFFFHKFLERTRKGKIQEPYESIHVKLLWEKNVSKFCSVWRGYQQTLKKFLSFSHTAVFYSFERSNTYLGIQLLCLIRSSASSWL